ncbi:MAG: hypothetical protein AMJ65_08170 [Phycisphaerae bacterium SG8_4]|nr:MAG: hypothetical protein AMJ65_08170 [Phycisphaerae bacterium SG8_4]
MKVSEHFVLIKDIRDSLALAFERFKKEHHDDCECWFSLEWGMCMNAFDDTERTKALDELEKQYKRLEAPDGHSGNPDPC